MNEELIKQVEQLIEFGYGDTLRLDSIVDALRNGRSLYPSDQKYVDMQVSKYLYPHEEPVEESKVESLEQKIKKMKEGYYGNKKINTIQENVSVNYCNKCGSIIVKTYDFCPKCGTYQKGSKGDYTGQIKQKRYTGIAAAGIILIILGAISFIILSEYSSICGSNIGIFAQIVSQNALQECTVVQIFNTLGIIMLIIGIVLLIIRAVKTRN